MYCRKCGKEISDSAKFCAGCGCATTIGTDEQRESENTKKEETIRVDNNEVLYSLRPEFNYGYKICTTVGKIILYILVIAFYLWAELSSSGLSLLSSLLFSEMSIFIMIALAFVLVYIILKLVFEKKQYDNLEYNFFANKMEYIDGFINKEEKELKYKNIREVTMSQNIIERIFSIGTIKIFTNASSGVSNGSRHGQMNNRNGIIIHCVTNVRENYEKIKEIIDAND